MPLEPPVRVLRLMRRIEMGTKLGIRSLRTGTHDSHARALGSRAREEARPPSPSYLEAMSDEQKHLKQIIKYLDIKQRGLPYNDPERRKTNFQKHFWELMDRTGVTFNDDPDHDAPYLKGPTEGIAEVAAFMKKEGQPGFYRND